jgi:HEPN domain-containing protein
MNDPEPTNVAELWLQRARSDFHLGEAALHTPGVMLEDACFHAQQCAEKALKALLLHQGINFPRTHAIDLLLDLLKNAGVTVPPDIDEAFVLTDYAVEARYPGYGAPIHIDGAKQALLLAKKVLEWVEHGIS